MAKVKGEDEQVICIANPPPPGSMWRDNEYASPEWKRIELGDIGDTHPEYRTLVLGEFAPVIPRLCASCKSELCVMVGGRSAARRLRAWHADTVDVDECTRCNPPEGE